MFPVDCHCMAIPHFQTCSRMYKSISLSICKLYLPICQVKVAKFQNQSCSSSSFISYWQVLFAKLLANPLPQSSLPSVSPMLFAKCLAYPLRQASRQSSSPSVSRILFASSGWQCAPLDLIRQGLIAVCTAGR